ncbi:MAG: D-2-hydroxyacid dehydrogenase [Steroidobacteraceae bacterium]|nr:D-2-hydroxyacid dehydrogenase [Steroidobacteraceae bacterium]
MSKKRLLVWTGGDDKPLTAALRGVSGIEVVTARTREDALRAMPEVDAFVTSTIPWDRDFAFALSRATRLVWVQLLNTGFDNVEYLGVPERVVVSTIGEIGSGVVAEHALALLLALVRQVPSALAAQRRGEWSFGSTARRMSTLRGREVAVIGFGHIGRAFASMASACGARVTGVARSARTSPEGFEVQSYEALASVLRKVSAVVICAPLNRTTEKLIDVQAFAALQPGSYLVNVARGGIVDTDALVAALERGVLAGAALDVMDPEPLPAGHPLWTHPNVIITPHVAAMGQAAVREAQLQELTVENVKRFLQGEPVRNIAPIGAGAAGEGHAHR